VSNKSKQKIFNEVVGVICQRFPATFFIHKPKPLKIGIYDDLLAVGVLDEKGLSAFLRAYCKLGRYLAVVVPGAQRVDLDGNPTGEVTAEEAQLAATALSVLHERRAARKALSPNTETA
jgi:ProP effector